MSKGSDNTSTKNTTTEQNSQLRVEFNGNFAFKGYKFSGRAGAFKITELKKNEEGKEVKVDKKGVYFILNTGEEKLGLIDLIQKFNTDSVKEEDITKKIPSIEDITKKIPSIIDEKSLVNIKSFYIKYFSEEAKGSEFDIGVETKIKINNEELDFTLIYQYRKEKNKQLTEVSSHTFGGILKWGVHRFSVKFSKENNSTSFLASYMLQGEAQIDLKKIAHDLFKIDVENLSLGLKQPKAFFIYNKLKVEDKEETRLIFGVGAKNINLNFKGLPLVGNAIPDGALDFKDLLIIIASKEVDAATIRKIDTDLFEDIQLPDQIGKFNLSLTMKIGANEFPFSIVPKEIPEGTKIDPEKKDISGTDTTNSKSASTEDAKVTSIPGTVSSSAKFLDVKKKLGPVELHRVGFGFVNNNIILLLDASFTLAALGVQLKGLGLGFALKWPPKVNEFYLDGLGISFKKNPIEVSGAFMRGIQIVEEKDEKGDVIKDEDGIAIVTSQTVYTGAAVLKLSKFTISGIGSYANVKVWVDAKDENGLVKRDSKNNNAVIKEQKSYTSLFIYAVYDGPIGGPAFFFVTGIATGFGMNRKVNVPAIDEVGNFPLVSLAMNSSIKPQKSLMQILTDLQTPQKSGKLPIEISYGDYWLAVGIKFTSFKIIDSFVLLIVSFGNRLRFDILGLSVLSLPPKIGDAIEPLVYVELALKISFGSDSDLISVEAMITPNSYVFGKDAKLRGGFALYLWVSGEHEGDFVVSLGGYHPLYKKPAHYPNVDRLSLNWKFPLIPLTIKGEMYFALTPAAIMAGGRWEVTFDLGFVRAYLIIWADILIQWAPLFYVIEGGVRIGVEVNIKIGGLLIHFKLEIGAQLRIWGPPFAGNIKVQLWIFSFTIPFGDGSKKLPPPQTWEQFQDSFIPTTKVEEQKSIKAKTNKEKETQLTKIPNPLEIRIQKGVIKNITDDNDQILEIIVNPYSLELEVDSFFPISEIYRDELGTELLNEETLINLSSSDVPIFYKGRNEQPFGIKPMKMDEVTTKLHVWLEKIEGKPNKPNEKISENIICQVNAKGMPKALWDKIEKDTNDESLKKEENAILPSLVSGLEIHTIEGEIKILEDKETLNNYDCKIGNTELKYLSNSNARTSKIKLKDTIKNIKKANIAREAITNDLKNLGFVISSLDELNFNEIEEYTKVYDASIGQMIPSKLEI